MFLDCYYARILPYKLQRQYQITLKDNAARLPWKSETTKTVLGVEYIAVWFERGIQWSHTNDIISCGMTLLWACTATNFHSRVHQIWLWSKGSIIFVPGMILWLLKTIPWNFTRIAQELLQKNQEWCWFKHNISQYVVIIEIIISMDDDKLYTTEV